MFGDIVQGIGSLIGGWMNSEATKEANAANAAAAERNAQRNIDYQKEFAQSGLQWKVEDAQKAGIHPLYAMGAAGASFAPVSIAGGEARPNTVIGDALSKSGQAFGRAIESTQPRDQQATAIANQAAQLQLTNAGLQNELLAAQVAKAKQELITRPAMPSLAQRWTIPGQGDVPGSSGLGGFTPKWEEKNERVTPDPAAPHRESFSVTDIGHSRTAGGGYSAIPSKDVQERIEDNWLQQMMWMFRNNILPSVGINESPPPRELLPKGYDDWRYHPFYQEYRPHKRGWFGINY